VEAAAAEAAARRGHTQRDGRAARRPVRRHLVPAHLLHLGDDAALELDGEHLDGARARRRVRRDEGPRELRAVALAEVVEEALAAEAEHLRRLVVPRAHLVERRHVDPRTGRERHLVRARRAPALLRHEQPRDEVGALARRERRTFVLGALRARRRIGAHLHELGRGVVAQPLAQLGRAARVAHGVVEGEPRLRAVAPDHGGVQDRARSVAVRARRTRAVWLAGVREQLEAACDLVHLRAWVLGQPIFQGREAGEVFFII
jgi:hypothetical protein